MTDRATARIRLAFALHRLYRERFEEARLPGAPEWTPEQDLAAAEAASNAAAERWMPK